MYVSVAAPKASPPIVKNKLSMILLLSLLIPAIEPIKDRSANTVVPSYSIFYFFRSKHIFSPHIVVALFLCF